MILNVNEKKQYIELLKKEYNRSKELLEDKESFAKHFSKPESFETFKQYCEKLNEQIGALENTEGEVEVTAKGFNGDCQWIYLVLALVACEL